MEQLKWKSSLGTDFEGKKEGELRAWDEISPPVLQQLESLPWAAGREWCAASVILRSGGLGRARVYMAIHSARCGRGFLPIGSTVFIHSGSHQPLQCLQCARHC